MSATDRVFHLFPKLPPEIQLKIWKLASEPQCIELDTRRGGPHDFIKTSKVQGNRFACLDSRREALDQFTDGHILSYTWPLSFHPWEADQRLTHAQCFSLAYNPKRDTIYFKDYYEYRLRSSHYSITPGTKPDPASGLHCIRSMAIGGYFTDGFLHLNHPPEESLRCRLPSDLDFNNMPVFSPPTGIFFIGAHDFLRQLSGIEELILVNPSWQELSQMPLHAAADGPMRPEYEFVRGPDIEETKRRALSYVAKLEAELQKMKGAVLEGAVRRHQEKFGKEFGLELSEWWDNPKITLMTEDEFEARF